MYKFVILVVPVCKPGLVCKCVLCIRV